MKLEQKHVYYDEKNDEIVLISAPNHQSFGVWFYPAHGIIWLGEL